ncbi:MAG: superfamily [Acidimicrobiales bacterium]|nr:superfamily [Acidimicrobiales bacterium]
MTVTAEQKVEQLPAQVRRRQRGLRWWKEVLYVLAFYAVYSAIRNTQGSASVSAKHALDNALDIIRLERSLGLFHEHAIQHAVLTLGRVFIEFWNLFYGTFHFFVTAGALIYVFRRFPERYARWRNTLALTTALALVGFALYPLMPPRLLDLHGMHYGFVDTLERYGSLWSFDSGTMQKISNQYAAMPSLHFAWSLWCALILFPVLRRNWTKALAAIYPALTLFAIVVTANHFVLDAAGGAVCLGLGYLLGGVVTRRWEKRPAREAAVA